MLIETFLRGLVIVGRDHEDAVKAGEVGVLDSFANVCGAVSAESEEQGKTSLVDFPHAVHDRLLFVLREAGRLRCCAQDAEKISFSLNLRFHQSRKSFEVNATVGKERSDEGCSRASERIVFFHVGQCCCTFMVQKYGFGR